MAMNTWEKDTIFPIQAMSILENHRFWYMSHGNHSQNQVFYIFVSVFHQESRGIRRCFFQEREMMKSTHWIMMIIFRLSWEINLYLSRPEVDKTSGWGPMGQVCSSGNPCWGHVVCLCKKHSFSPPARWGLLGFITVVLLLRCLLLLILHLLLLLPPFPLLQLLLHHLCIHSHVHFRLANSSPSFANFRTQWALLDLNCKGLSALGTAGPQPGTFRAQWAPLDLNGQIECQKICQIERQIECQKDCQIKCQNVCQIECQKICRIECQKVCQIECQIKNQKICQIKCQNVCQNICQIECQMECQKICQKKCQIECQKICQNICQKICQVECQKICQIECQKICQIKCQKICQIEC